MKITLRLALFLAILSNTSISFAEVEIIFDDPKKFDDYQLTDTSRRKSLEILRGEFTALFEQNLSNVLSSAHLMKVKITNIDLPGNISVSRDIVRRYGDIRFVRLDFSYSIKDNTGTKEYEGEYQLVHKTRRPRIARKFSNWKETDLFKKPLKKWFHSMIE